MIIKKNNFIIFFAILSNIIFSQNKYTILDSLTNEKIAFANIWKDNKIFSNSDKDGIFSIENIDKNSKYKVSCLGYKTKNIDLSQKEILLNNDIINLNEIVISNKKSNKKIKLGSIKNKDILVAANYNDKIAEIGKVFIPKDTTCLFLKEIKFNTFSLLQNATVKLNIYSLDVNMMPLQLITTESLICEVKKGNIKSEINIEPNLLIVPKHGFMISIQILLLEENKNYREYNKNIYQYEPSLWVKKNSPNDYTLNLSEYNSWKKIPNTDLNIEITLTN